MAYVGILEKLYTVIQHTIHFSRWSGYSLAIPSGRKHQKGSLQTDFNLCDKNFVGLR